MFLLPTRSRPEILERFIDAYIRTQSTAAVGVLYDDNDPRIDVYERLSHPRDFCRIMTCESDGIGEKYQEGFRLYPNEDWYGLIGDDNVPVTHEWDKRLIEAAGADGVAWPKDGINDGSFGTLLVIGGDLIREMGWLSPPGMKHLFLDRLWSDIGRARGKAHYLSDVSVEHWHFSNGKAAYDDTYRRHARFADGDRRVYERLVSELHL
jgi:hypothetical protein